MRRGAAGGSEDSAAEVLAAPAAGEMLGAAIRQPEITKVARIVEREMKVFIMVEVQVDCRMPGEWIPSLMLVRRCFSWPCHILLITVFELEVHACKAWALATAAAAAGTFVKSGMSPSSMVGWVKMASRNAV